MDNREALTLADIFIGVLLTCAVIGTVLILYRVYSPMVTEYGAKIEHENITAPAVRLVELNTLQDDVLCTTAASVLQDCTTLQMYPIHIDGNDYDVLDDAINYLLSKSGHKCSVSVSGNNDIGYDVTITVNP